MVVRYKQEIATYLGYVKISILVLKSDIRFH